MTATMTAANRPTPAREPDRFSGYPVRLPIYEGPLDLLLYLVKENRYDIFDIPIAAITAQFLEYIQLMQLLDLELAGDFLVEAGNLMVLKSKMLLPPDEEESAASAEQGADPQAELARRLEEYQRFREAAEQLNAAHELRERMFEPAPNPENGDGNGYYGKSFPPLMHTMSLFDFVKVFAEVLARAADRPMTEVRRDIFTVPQRMRAIAARLQANPDGLTFWELCEDCEMRLEVIVTFLALLEIIRRGRAQVWQEDPFSAILVKPVRRGEVVMSEAEAAG